MGGWSTSRPGRFTPGRDPVPTVKGAGWAPGPVWTCAKISPATGAAFPERPARSESLYRLSYPGPLDNNSIVMNMEYRRNITEREKGEVFGDKPIQGPLRSPQIPHELECDLPQVSDVSWLMACTLARSDLRALTRLLKYEDSVPTSQRTLSDCIMQYIRCTVPNGQTISRNVYVNRQATVPSATVFNTNPVYRRRC